MYSDGPGGSRAALCRGRGCAARAGRAVAVFLASGQGDTLSGRFLSITDNVAELVQQAEEIRRADRYVLRLRK